jgi:hypothetical protein
MQWVANLKTIWTTGGNRLCVRFSNANKPICANRRPVPEFILAWCKTQSGGLYLYNIAINHMYLDIITIMSIHVKQ